jgi:amidase
LSAELNFAEGRELARAIGARELSARQVMEAHLAAIAKWNPLLNAIVAKLDDDRCLALADEADRRLAAGTPVGPLHGLPIAFKDLEPAVGFPWTRGSPIFRDDFPAEDSVLVERLRRAGAIPIGKTNVPEFGMGSHTFNSVYGTTRNPYDPTKTAGGSSGGAGAALAAGLLPFADGSDLGGSLRNPANFNNVVALRPTVGLVPTAPTALPFASCLTKGPMGRTVADVAFLLSIMAGADPRDPACHPSDPRIFAAPLRRDFQGARIAWSLDLGTLPLEPAVRAALEPCRKTLLDLGCAVEDAAPDLRAAEDIFLTLRAWRSAQALGPLLSRHRADLKPEALTEIDAGLRLTGAEIAAAMTRHAELLLDLSRFFTRFDFLVTAVNQVAPFDASIRWPTEIAGVPMESYVAWMRSAYWISTTLQPALSVPAGFTDSDLPVGIQLVGRRHDDLGVLQLGHAFEQATRVGLRRPPDA